MGVVLGENDELVKAQTTGTRTPAAPTSTSGLLRAAPHPEPTASFRQSIRTSKLACEV